MAAGMALAVGGSLVSYGSGMLSSYANYKAQKAQLKQQYKNAKANYQTMTDNANAALSALSYNEGVLSREHNRRLAEVESAFAVSGVSGASVSAQDVYERQVEANVEELWNMRRQTNDDVGNLVLNRNNMMAEAEASYKWGKKANKLSMIFSMLGQTSNFAANMASVPWSAFGGSGGSMGAGDISGMYGGGATDLVNMGGMSAIA